MNTILSDESISAQQQSQATLIQPSDATILPSPTTPATAATTPSNENNIGDTSEQYRVVEGTKNWTKQKKNYNEKTHTHTYSFKTQFDEEKNTNWKRILKWQKKTSKKTKKFESKIV